MLRRAPEVRLTAVVPELATLTPLAEMILRFAVSPGSGSLSVWLLLLASAMALPEAVAFSLEE